MKKVTILALFTAFYFTTLSAQTLDTLSMGLSYSIQNWYKFETDKETKSPTNNWDLGFSAVSQDASIWVNPKATLYKAVAPVSAWATISVDTTALLATGITQVNSDTIWSVGALNRTQNGVFDYGWGNYSTASHNVTGDSVYVIKAATDGKWRKFYIVRLALDTSYFVNIADLNGANPISIEVKKSAYAGKNFGYYSFATAAQIDREPLTKDWDITVWQHWGLTPDQTGTLQSYLLTGMLQNAGTSVAKVVKRDTANKSFTGQIFKPQINTIGADWKTFNPATNLYKVPDSTAYFIKTVNGKIFKMVFTGFGGSPNGNCIFTRELVGQVAVRVDAVNNKIAALAVSPNPASDGQFNIVYDFGSMPQQADFQLFNLAGQAIYRQKLQNTEGVQVLQMPTLNLANGIYLARLTFDGNTLIRKIVIR